MAKVTISGILRDYGKRAAQAARQALEENAEIVLEEARARCPVDTGKLRDSLHLEKKGADKIRIVADAQNKGYYYGRLLEYAPNGKPFMRPALESKREEIHRNVLEKIRGAIT